MIDALLAHALARHGDKIAIVAHDGELSYWQLAAATQALALKFSAAGIAKGDRIVVQLPNSCAAVVGLLAVSQVGAVPVPVQASLRGAAAESIAVNCEPRLVLTMAALARNWTSPVWSAPTDYSSLAKMEPLPLPQTPRPVGDLAAILYTSGSTGQPKGVMLTRANMLAALAAVHEYLEPRPADCYFSALPLSSSYGLYQVISALSLGSKIVLDRSFAFPLQSISLLARHWATIFAAVPTQVAWILGSAQDLRQDLSTLRIVTTAAAALPVQHALRFQAMVPNARLFVMYGQTECKRISYLEPGKLAIKQGSVGRGLRIQQHRIVDADGRAVAPGVAGELAVQGPHVMQGYWRNQELTDQALTPLPGETGLWLRTGDQFRQDDDGYLYFQGRSDEMLKIGGHKVSPLEIENVIASLPDVSEVAVIGQPDPDWGQAATAFVVLAQGREPDADKIRLHCAGKLARYMVPKAIVFMDELPKTESGKVRKQQLMTIATG